MPDGAFLSQSAKITLLNFRDTIATAYTDSQGQFTFSNLAAGNYVLEVEADRQRFEVVNESVQVFRGAPSVVTIPLRVKASTETRMSGSKTVSVGELDPNVPKAAKREFERGSQASNEGKIEEAIAHLRKATALYPNFLQARNDLGTQLLAQGKLDEAAEELRKAVSLSESAFNPALNLGIVLVHQQRFSEAAGILGRAISLEPNSPAARLYSGLAAMGLGDLDAAEKDLKAASTIGGSQFALALFHLGRLYMSKGDRESALNAFQLYLKEVPNAANAEEVRKSIAMLR